MSLLYHYNYNGNGNKRLCRHRVRHRYCHREVGKSEQSQMECQAKTMKYCVDIFYDFDTNAQTHERLHLMFVHITIPEYVGRPECMQYIFRFQLNLIAMLYVKWRSPNKIHNQQQHPAHQPWYYDRIIFFGCNLSFRRYT